MKTSYVDVAVRIEVTHGMDEDPTELVCDCNYQFAGEGIGNTEMKECVTAGTKDENGALVREDGQTGRTVELHHTPPVE